VFNKLLDKVNELEDDISKLHQLENNGEMETSEWVTKAMSDDCGWAKHLDEAFRKTIVESLQTIIESKSFHLLLKNVFIEVGHDNGKHFNAPTLDESNS